jgi:hypothetical protein
MHCKIIANVGKFRLEFAIKRDVRERVFFSLVDLSCCMGARAAACKPLASSACVGGTLAMAGAARRAAPCVSARAAVPDIWGARCSSRAKICNQAAGLRRNALDVTSRGAHTVATATWNAGDRRRRLTTGPSQLFGRLGRVLRQDDWPSLGDKCVGQH